MLNSSVLYLIWDLKKNRHSNGSSSTTGYFLELTT